MAQKLENAKVKQGDNSINIYLILFKSLSGHLSFSPKQYAYF